MNGIANIREMRRINGLSNQKMAFRAGINYCRKEDYDKQSRRRDITERYEEHYRAIFGVISSIDNLLFNLWMF